jgi:hypothetical protein
MVGTSFVLVGWARPNLLSGPPDTTVAITWRTGDDGSVSIKAIDARRVRVGGEHPGSGWVEGQAFGTGSRINVTVLQAADTSAVSPIVIDDFRVYEHHYGWMSWEWTYSPQISLHDRSGSSGSAVIAASFDIPGLEPSAPCAMLRPIGGGAGKLFSYEAYFQEFELNVRQPGRSSVPGAVAVAHLTVRLPNKTAMQLTVSGPVVSAAQLPTTDEWPAQTADYLSCE